MSYEVDSADYTISDCLALTEEKYHQARQAFLLCEMPFTAPPPRHPPQQIVFDVTNLFSGKDFSGIPRVSLCLARCLHAVPSDGGLPVKFVTFDGKNFQSIALQDPAAGTRPFGFVAANLRHGFAPGDVLLLAEQNNQKNLDAYFSAVATARSKGAQLAYLVHDLQPLLDKTAYGPAFNVHFLVWWSQVLRFADRMITVSRKAAGDIACYASVTSMQGLTPTRKLPVSYFRLGSDALVGQGGGESNPQLPVGPETFYAVGNLFGYKGSLIVLQAMEMLWSEGSDAKLVMVGRDASNLTTRSKLQSHPEIGKKFVLPGFVSDAELAHALQNCGALIAASRMEGFGLPLVEAAALGCPVIARDNEIFRETSGGRAFFF